MPHASGSTIKPQVKLGRTPESCWEWLGGKTAAGYGKKTFHGRTYLAHRWLFMQLFGPIPDGMVIDHTCQNPGCVNPHHLRAVTQATNCRSGDTAKLTPGDVVEIKSVPKADRARKRAGIAFRFGISPQLVSDIWAGRAWTAPKKFRGRTGATLPHPDQQEQIT